MSHFNLVNRTFNCAWKPRNKGHFGDCPRKYDPRFVLVKCCHSFLRDRAPFRRWREKKSYTLGRCLTASPLPKRPEHNVKRCLFPTHEIQATFILRIWTNEELIRIQTVWERQSVTVREFEAKRQQERFKLLSFPMKTNEKLRRLKRKQKSASLYAHESFRSDKGPRMISVIVGTNVCHTIISETFEIFQLCRCSNCFVISMWGGGGGWMIPFNTGYVPGCTVVPFKRFWTLLNNQTSGI